MSRNPYSYVKNNPLKYTDPSGEIADPTDAACGLTGPAALPCLGAKELLEAIGIGIYIYTSSQNKADIPTTIPSKGINAVEYTLNIANNAIKSTNHTAPPVQQIQPKPSQPSQQAKAQTNQQTNTVASQPPNGQNDDDKGEGSKSLLDELQPTLNRIAKGEKFPHRNDGAIFKNKEMMLPKKEVGYYKEYVHPTPGVNHAGLRRIIIGSKGEVWFTRDHYKIFIRIK